MTLSLIGTWRLRNGSTAVINTKTASDTYAGLIDEQAAAAWSKTGQCLRPPYGKQKQDYDLIERLGDVE